MKNSLYKKIYNIAVYSSIKEGETLLALLDNAKEFAHFLQTTENSAKAILSKLFHKKMKYIVVNKKFATVEFLNLEDDE